MVGDVGLAGVAIDSVEDMKVRVCVKEIDTCTFQSFSVEQCRLMAFLHDSAILVIEICTYPHSWYSVQKAYVVFHF